MKNHKYMLAMLLSSSLLVGCQGDFLNLPSETSLSTAVYYKSQSDFEQAINGAYAPLRDLYNGTYGAWAMGEMRSDNTTYKYNPNDRGTIEAEFVKNFLDDATNGVPRSKYVIDYRIISRVNHLLEPIDAVSFDQKIKDNIKGQAYFLRALAYFDLVQYFGSVPIHLKPAKTQADSSTAGKRSSSTAGLFTAGVRWRVRSMMQMPDRPFLFCHPKRIKSLVGQRRERQTLFWVMYI